MFKNPNKVYKAIMKNREIFKLQKYLNDKIQEDENNGASFDENVPIFELPKTEFDSFTKIASDYMNGSNIYSKNRKLFLVMGLPCSGKSSILVDKIQSQQNAFVVDSDEIKKYLKGYENGIGGSRVHKKSSYILDNFILPKCAYQGIDIVLPVICKSKTSFLKYYNIFCRYGYAIEIYNVEVSLSTSMERAVSRYFKTGRFTSIDYIYSIGSNSAIRRVYRSIVSDAHKGVYANIKKAETYNNEVKYGEKPKLVNKYVF